MDFLVYQFIKNFSRLNIYNYLKYNIVTDFNPCIDHTGIFYWLRFNTPQGVLTPVYQRLYRSYKQGALPLWPGQ